MGLGAGLLRQSYLRVNEAHIREVTSTGELTSRSILAMSFSAIAGVEVPLPWRAFILLEAQAQARRLPAQAQPEWTVGVLGQMALGVRL